MALPDAEEDAVVETIDRVPEVLRSRTGLPDMNRILEQAEDLARPGTFLHNPLLLRPAPQNRMLRVRKKVRPQPAARGPSVAEGCAVLVESFASVRL